MLFRSLLGRFQGLASIEAIQQVIQAIIILDGSQLLLQLQLLLLGELLGNLLRTLVRLGRFADGLLLRFGYHQRNRFARTDARVLLLPGGVGGALIGGRSLTGAGLQPLALGIPFSTKTFPNATASSAFLIAITGMIFSACRRSTKVDIISPEKIKGMMTA